MTDTSSVAAGQLRSLIDRILRLREDADQIAKDVREVYLEAKSSGFNKTAIGLIVAETRKRDKDSGAYDETQAIVDLYRDALAGRVPAAPAPRTHTREAAKPEVSAALIETVAAGLQTEIGRKALVTAMDIMIEREEEVDQTTGELIDNREPAPIHAFAGITIPDDQLVSVRYPDGVRKVPYAEFKRGVAAAQAARAA